MPKLYRLDSSIATSIPFVERLIKPNHLNFYVSANPEEAQQDSQQRRQDQVNKAPTQHPGSPEYTGNPDQDLASYTERMNGLNRLFRSFNWKKGDESQQRRVRKLIENQRKLENESP